MKPGRFAISTFGNFERSNGYSVRLGLIERDGADPILSFATFCLGERRSRVEIYAEDLDALQAAIDALRLLSRPPSPT